MKFIYMGHDHRAPSFYTQFKDNRIRGYSKTIESGDIILIKGFHKVESVTKRDYYGSFENPEDSKGAFFDAVVSDINPLALGIEIPNHQEMFV